MDKDIKDLRGRIDAVDRQILNLFEQRIAISRQIGNYKKANGKDVFDPEREDAKLDKIYAEAGHESKPYVRSLFRELFDASKTHQSKPSFGVLGQSLPHTYSPEIHNLMAPEYSYSVIERQPEELDELFASKVFGGFNVTIPYKKEACKRCDVLDGPSKETGSVNTVVFKDGKTYGYNTDYYGFMYMLRRAGTDPKGKKVLILGTGGAASAVLYALKTLGAGEIRSCDLDTEINYSNVYDLCSDSRILVNCTPVGMYPKVDAELLDLDKFPDLEACLDVVYNPSRTKFLQSAQSRGLKTAGGLAMLVAQAWKSSRYFVGDLEGAAQIDEKAEENIESVIKTLENRMRNITLIGMPGCGKTILARELARVTGRDLVDLDAAFLEKYGITSSDSIREEGEEAFRAKESEVAAEYLSKSNLVISCGGGIVTQERNFFYIRCNSNVFYLNRPLETLSMKNRPLSSTHGVEKLFSERKEKYEMLADYTLTFDRFEVKQDFLDAATQEILKDLS